MQCGALPENRVFPASERGFFASHLKYAPFTYHIATGATKRLNLNPDTFNKPASALLGILIVHRRMYSGN